MSISVCTWVYLSLKDSFCSLIPQLTTVGGSHETMEKRQGAGLVDFHGSWTDVFQNIPLVCENGELPVVKTGTDVFQNIPLVCESGKLPVVQTGISIQFLLSWWGTLWFPYAASKEIMFFSLWDHINCSSSNGSFLLLRKCAGSGSLCQGYGRKLCWRWEECTVPSIQYTLTSKVQKRHGKCHEKS